MGPGGPVAEPWLRKVKYLVPVQFVGKEPPSWALHGRADCHFSTQSAHVSLSQEPNAQTPSLPPLPGHLCFTLSQEGSLEWWPGQYVFCCFFFKPPPKDIFSLL